MSRRGLCVLGMGAVLLPSARAARSDTTLIAAWQDGAEQRIGLLSVGEASWSVQRSLTVPTLSLIHI